MDKIESPEPEDAQDGLYRQSAPAFRADPLNVIEVGARVEWGQGPCSRGAPGLAGEGARSKGPVPRGLRRQNFAPTASRLHWPGPRGREAWGHPSDVPGNQQGL